MIKVRDLCDSDEQFKFLKLIIKEFNAQEVSFYENVVRKGIKILSQDLVVKLNGLNFNQVSERIQDEL